MTHMVNGQSLKLSFISSFKLYCFWTDPNRLDWQYQTMISLAYWMINNNSFPFSTFIYNWLATKECRNTLKLYDYRQHTNVCVDSTKFNKIRTVTSSISTQNVSFLFGNGWGKLNNNMTDFILTRHLKKTIEIKKCLLMLFMSI